MKLIFIENLTKNKISRRPHSLLIFFERFHDDFCKKIFTTTIKARFLVSIIDLFAIKDWKLFAISTKLYNRIIIFCYKVFTDLFLDEKCIFNVIKIEKKCLRISPLAFFECLLPSISECLRYDL